jgi:hypothetical protein
VARRAGDYDVRLPARPINALFEAVTRFENGLFRTLGISPALGSSLFAIAERPDRR